MPGPALPEEELLMSALEEYAEKLAKRGGSKEWRVPVPADFAVGKLVLSFDQSLANTGWVILSVDGYLIEVVARGTIRTVSPLKGPSQSFHKMRLLKAQVAEEFPAHSTTTYDDVVVEMPAVFGQRTESSLMAASVLDGYWNAIGSPITLVSIQHSRTVLCGTMARNKKDLGHKGLAKIIPDSAKRTWNEHQRDAALNGLAHLWDLKQMENADD